MELQRNVALVRREGLGLAAVSYDSPDTLRAFAGRHGITFPLLSDPGSKTIAAWGLLNREATGRAAGVPHPGTFIIGRDGRVVERAFETPYQERSTAASVLARLPGAAPPPAGAEAAGKYLRARSSLSDPAAAPGERLTLFVDVTPGPKMHVYAPEQTGYIPVAVRLDPSADFKAAAPPRFPPSVSYFFAPLKETVRVYDRPFRIAQDITLALTPDLRRRAAAGGSLTLGGSLEYQACDDAVCYRPDSVPLAWTIRLLPLQ